MCMKKGLTCSAGSTSAILFWSTLLFLCFMQCFSSREVEMRTSMTLAVLMVVLLTRT
ncbi:hypothetical protein ABKV19_004534, partial [Rosa sericea]